MKIYFDKYNQPTKPKVYLGSPNNKIICALDGIDDDSFEIDLRGNNTSEISFNVYRFITVPDFIAGTEKEIESKAYPLLGMFMRVYVENIGWFIMQPPTVYNDGKQEYKSVSAESCEIEMQQHDINNLKINKGTTDSYEMLVDGNVEMVGDVEFAKEQIKFYNPQKPELSFLDIVLTVSDMHGWTVDYIDNIPKVYKYFEDGVQKEKKVLLADEIGTFDIEVQDLYSFLTQDAAKFFSCVFVFDCNNLTISAYRPENIGRDTNVNIGFRNIQQSNEISIDENNIFTRYYVQGSDDLGIIYVNFGNNYIENIDYFLNEKYLSKELIDKYLLWKNDVEIARNIYIENTRLYNKQQSIISELKNRVPLDDCSTDWSTFTDAELLEAQANYQAQLKGYEQFYVDEDGNFDEEALKNSSDSDTYYQIKDVILPSIQIEIDNRNLPNDIDPNDYIDSYKTDWKLYGLDELGVKIQTYKNNVKLAIDRGCDVPYDETSKYTQDYHDALYAKYLEAQSQLDAENTDSCMYAYNKRQEEVDSATSLQNNYDKLRNNAATVNDKTLWTHIDDETQEIFSFTVSDRESLSKLYTDGTYTNSNMFLTNSDDSVTAIDEQLKLLTAAQEDLDIASQPQYTYTSSLDNFLALYEYKNYIENLNIFDFLYLGTRDDYAVKLRCMSLSYNPLSMDNSLQITFSNMLKSASGRNDFSYLLDSSTGGSKSSSSGSNSNDFLSNEGVSLTSGLIQKLLASGAFKDGVSDIINNQFSSVGGSQTITLSELNAKMIKVLELYSENGFFQYLQAALISADKIIAESGTFKDLSALVAMIDNLLAGNLSAELGHIIKLTAENVTIDEAVIRDLIASQITVSMLKAGDISADRFHIVSDDGGLEIVGNTMQFKDANGTVRIQIGRDANNNFTFCLYDETGKGVLIDSDGIKDSAISDGLIKTDMIADGAVTEAKIDKTNMREWTDADGNKIFDVSKLYYGDDKFEVSYNTMKESVTTTSAKVDELEGKIGSIELMGEQIFKEIKGVTSPASITISAVCRNGSVVGDWYIDDVINTDFVASDKMSITIPVSYMEGKNSITVKVTDRTKKLYDLHTLYLLKDLDGQEGQPAISIIISSANGTVFNEDTTVSQTVCTCIVYAGVIEIIPTSYQWICMQNDDGNWVELGNEKTLTLPVEKNIIRKRLKCKVDIDPEQLRG